MKFDPGYKSKPFNRSS